MTNKIDSVVLKNNKDTQSNNDFEMLIHKKICFFKDIIQKTLLHVQRNKILDILGVSDVILCLDKLTELSSKLNDMKEITKNNSDTIINALQTINNELSSLLKNYGTESLDDLLSICFGNNKIVTDLNGDIYKYDLLQKYFHPTGYKVINKKELVKSASSTKVNDDTTNINDKTKNLDCFDVASIFKQFHIKVYGIKIYVYNEIADKALLVYGILDELMLSFVHNKYIIEKQKQIMENIPESGEFEPLMFQNFMDSLILKDYLIYDYSEIYNKFIGIVSQVNTIKQRTISQTIKDFISDDIYLKRLTLIQLLVKSDTCDNQYMAYLLYDLLSNDSNGNVDTQEQTIIFDSFPWSIIKKFLHSMKNTVQYTNELSNIEINKIPLEQQICLMKASDIIKEKAMSKLKEIKNKSEDSGSKARQYLEGLLKIPFGIYRKEPILNIMDSVKRQFMELIRSYDLYKLLPQIPNKEKYTSMEIITYIKKIPNVPFNNEYLENLKNKITEGSKSNIISNILKIKNCLSELKIKCEKMKYSNKKKSELKKEIENMIDSYSKEKNEVIIELDQIFLTKSMNKKQKINMDTGIGNIKENLNKITNYISDLRITLDSAVHGHEKAKKQIERIIGQWINGEQDGYCFGFEGPPGVGKTSLAKKGLSNCLKDEKGNPRPFAMIQIGGDSNGSTLHGHNYTYVGSTWGSIVQILMDNKCMNPIIFIDEIDKISRTEHGKEIIGILTHLLDPAQNDCFQDKYFTGIDLDLSKALFILSYNDAEVIDKILLDRIHRIKFKNLSLEDKLTICNTHILPEIYRKMGLEGMIIISDSVLNFIIDEYTQEAGVRKLKEILFEIISEINLDVLKNATDYIFPIHISIEDIRSKYLKDKRIVCTQKIHSKSTINIINGMYANSLGQGGILPFQCCFTPAHHFLEIILTGNQQNVMKEGMIISRNLAWNMTDFSIQKKLIKKYNDPKNNCIYGLNINALGLSTPKDGPSASSTITVLIYALLNNRKIKNTFAMTGEVSLDGNISEIGGLEYKILGSLKSLVTSFIFPRENEKDFQEFMKKYNKDDKMKDIQFFPVSTIQEVFEIILEKE
jgi:ATP-dependent Lon protease